MALFQFGAGTEFWSLFAVYLDCSGGWTVTCWFRCCSRKRSIYTRW
ncbi:hypothetical protein LNP74_19340 [Klebsiella pneumoniae subsp. pneumoniae]|nr:hypothetical protein [Klebsiella pneumoniae subsp. pneumoniae]